MDPLNPCEFAARYQTQTDCYIELRFILTQGEFVSFNANEADGFIVQQISPSEIWVTHEFGFIPPDNLVAFWFTLPYDLNTSMSVAFLNDCAQLGCEIIGGYPIDPCPGPQDASIIGVKYRECSALPYVNQTPLAGWTIQALDADGSIVREDITKEDGSYALYDLPKGQYIVREAQQSGWTASVPASGEIVVDLDYSEQRIVNFGNCPPAPPPCNCPPGTQPSGNLVVNGDFSGPSSFTTGYTLNSSPTLQPGQYWIGSNPSQINAGFAACGDHTGGGNMMVVNGASAANTNVWCKTFTMAPNSTYKFEAWMASLSTSSPAQLSVNFLINNVMWSQNFFAPTTTCTWQKFCFPWNNGSANSTNITICLVNMNVAGTGNDFALDDISFSRCVAPIGTITGRVYQTCDSMAYTGQPGLGGYTVQLLDTMGNLIQEQLSDTSGGYAFADLPLGLYWVRTVQQADGLPNYPSSGLAVIEVLPGETIIQHFGVCRLPQLPCGCPLNNAPGANLVTNPHFNTTGGFTSSYTFNTTAPPLPLGQYVITDDPYSINSDYQGCDDHTAGHGNMMIAAGKPGGASFPLYWEQGPITVQQNMTYYFSVWVAPLHGAYPDYIILEINSTVVAIQKLNAAPCAWRRICGTWNSGMANSATLKIRGFGVMGGDAIALDDVSFHKCSPDVIGPVTGFVYRTCTAEPYTNQPVLPNFTVQLLDTMGNLISEQVTDAGGEYAFADLPKGWYWVKIVQQTDGYANYPASGLAVIEVLPGQGVVQNFGICDECPGCQPASNLALTPLGPTSALLTWNSSQCSEREWTYVDETLWIHTLATESEVILQGLQPGVAQNIHMVSSCADSTMSEHSDTVVFYYPCFGGYNDCPGSLLANGGFEGPGSAGLPNAADQIGLCNGWQATASGASVNGTGDWYADGNITQGFYPGSYFDIPNQQYTLLHASCGYRYAGFDLNSCEGISSNLTAAVAPNTGYEVSFWWTPKEQVNANFTFLAILSGGSCTVNTANGGTVCTHQCGGDFHIPVTVTPAHQPGTWYFHQKTGNTPISVTQLTFTAQSSGAPVNNYIYVDEACVREVFAICDVGKPRITRSNDQPNAFFGEAELSPGATLLSAVWDFGDGTRDSSCCLGSVIHNFEPGTYEVCLTVTAADTSGGTCSNSTCITVVITTQSTKCDNIAAFLYPSFIGDCCFSLNTNNIEPNCFTQLDVTLSSGSFVNTQFDGNWNIAINGNTASLTPALGGFIPTGQTIPLTICDPQGSDPYHLDVDFVYAGGVCERDIDFSCGANCTCLGFSNLQFFAQILPPLPPVPVDCDNETPVVLPCVPNDVIYNLEGNFGCSNECPSSVQFEIFDAQHNLLQYGLAYYDSGLDQFNLNPGFKFQPGTYQIVLTGYCGTNDTCTCTLNFEIPPCGCCSPNYQSFVQTADQGTTLVSVPSSCSAQLNVGPLPCQRVQWINWGDGNISNGPFLQGSAPAHTYTQSGSYTVSYMVVEINPTTGQGCYAITFTETITVTCPSCNCTAVSLAFERDGNIYPVSCDNDAQNPTFGCPVSDVTLNGGFGCVQPDGTICTQSLISWNLYGPNGFINKGTLTGPGLGITFPASDIGAPGLYTVSLQTLCPGQTDSCYCQLEWTQSDCSPMCCQGDLAAFIAAAMNVQPNGTLGTCAVQFNATGLSSCLRITYDWGDGSGTGPITADNVPVSHTYAQSGTYNICYTIEEVNNSGFACHSLPVCEPVQIICNDCVCGSFSNVYARPAHGAPSILLSAGGSYNFSCPSAGFSIPITGSFQCAGGMCAPSTTVNWTLAGPSGSFSGSVPAGPFFYLPISPVQYGTPGTYTLTLTGNCGGQPCTPFVVTFTIACPDPCPCDLAQLQIDANKGFASALNMFGCSGCFSPIGLNDCDEVRWSVNGGPQAATTWGTQSFCYTFPGSGQHVVTMTVIRRRGDGSICGQVTVSRTVNITCLGGPDCSTSVFRNPTMSEGAVPGDLSATGAATGWRALLGSPTVVEGVNGSDDAWSIRLLGNRDTSDVLTQTEPICLQKSSGTLSFRIARKPQSDCCFPPDDLCCYYPDISFGCKLNIQLFRGEDFVLEYPTWNPIRCLRLISLDLPTLGSGWNEVELPYDASDWGVVDTCGDAPHGIMVRPVIYVTNELGHEQGGAATRSTVYIDNFCMDGALVGTHTPSANKSLRIYPNPNTGVFTLELPAAAKPGTVFRISDLTGRVLRETEAQTGSDQQTIQMAQLPDGLYFLQVVVEGRVLGMEKFVKQR